MFNIVQPILNTQIHHIDIVGPKPTRPRSNTQHPPRLNEAVAPSDFRRGEQYTDLERNGVVGSCSEAAEGGTEIPWKLVHLEVGKSAGRM